MCLVVVSMTMTVSAANEWAGGGDGLWNTAANWTTTINGPPVVVTHIVPATEADEIGDARINQTGANACTITGTPNASCQWLHIGNNAGATGTLNVVAGGQLGTAPWGPGETFMAEGLGSTAILNIDGAGSIARSEGWRIGRTDGGSTAIVNITNGGALYGVWWDNFIRPNATINIISGKMWILGAAQFVVDGVIDISGTSELFVQTDRKALIDSYIAAGKIIGNGVAGHAVATIDVNGNTIVTAIPEPVTLALLGLGGLFLRRRNA